MKKTLLIIASSALVTGLAIKAAPALSQTPSLSGDVNVAVVRTADLDLSTRAGQRLLDRRLIGAAAELCGKASDVDLKGQNDVRQCREEVLSAARARADALLAGTSERKDIVIAARQ